MRGSLVSSCERYRYERECCTRGLGFCVTAMMMEMAREPGTIEQLSGPTAWWRCVLKVLWGPPSTCRRTGAGFGFIAS